VVSTNPPFPCLTICGVSELDDIDLSSFTHVISIWDPVWETRAGHQDQFIRRLATTARVHFAYFDDIPAPMDQRFAASLDQVQHMLDFARTIESPSRVLIHCWAGISRSTAVAYAVLCQHTGPGHETACLDHIRKIRPQAIPNSLIITLAEASLGRSTAMFDAYEKMLSRLIIDCPDDEL
jgi:predicted protein tyrosine phosphatase